MEHDAENRLLWGACQGSGASAYRVAVEISDLGAKCSCPSRKFPCKHAIALMWWHADDPGRFTEAEIPDWVNEWQGRRRRTAPDGGNDAPGPKKSAKAALADEPAKPKDEARSKAQKERSRKAREKSIRASLDELDLWINDQVDRGFGAFAAQANEQCRLLAKRLVDAKAGGLASLVDDLPSLYFRTPEAERFDVLLERLGGLHLLAEAYRRQHALSDALRAEVRTRVGWTMTRDELFASPDATRVKGRWTVLATRYESQADRLVRFETYLASAADSKSPTTALLLDFVPASSASASGPSLEPGSELDAELVFYPSATPLRAQIESQANVAPASAAPSPAQSLGEALAGFDGLLAVNPWLDNWPIAFSNVEIRQDGSGRCWAVDGDAAVPVGGEAADALMGFEGLELYGTFDGRELNPLAANSPLGPMWTYFR